MAVILEIKKKKKKHYQYNPTIFPLSLAEFQ